MSTRHADGLTDGASSDYAHGTAAAAADIVAGNGLAVVGNSSEHAWRQGFARMSEGTDYDLGYLAEARRQGAHR